MKTTWVLVLAGLVGACPAGAADVPGDAAAPTTGRVHFTVEPFLGRTFGTARYAMNVTGMLDKDGMVTQDVENDLSFPLNAGQAGAYLGIRPAAGDPGVWLLEAGYGRSLSDPSSQWTNQTFVTVPILKEKDLEILNISSSPTTSSTELSLRGYRALRRGSQSGIGVSGGVWHRKITQNVVGFRGWALNDSTLQKVTVQDDTLRMSRYEANSTLIHAGLGAHFPTIMGLRAEIWLDPAVAVCKDTDDRPAQMVTSSASGVGLGIVSGFNLRHEYGQSDSGLRPFLGLRGEFVGMDVQTQETDTWYGDDPATPGNDTGLVVKDLPHRISGGRFNLGLVVGVSL